jgi:hypothetical protein
VTELGAWSRDDLQATIASAGGLGADSDMPDRTRFVGAVAKLVRKRLAIGTETRPLAIFLMSANAPDREGVAVERAPMLSNGRTVLCGRLWFVSPVAVSGHWLELETDNDDEIFKFVTDVIELGMVPAVILVQDEAGAELRFYPAGLGAPEIVTHPPITGGVDINQILAVIDHLWRSKMVTPGAQPAGMKLWANAAQGRPTEETEARVQAYVEIAIQEAFPSCVVRHEQSMVAGRLDLEVEEADPLDRSVITRHAILEMKVLRQFGANGAPITPATIDAWVTEGVEQAIAYRTEKGARAASVCCFDMRERATQEACFAHIRQAAVDADIVLRVWHLFRSAHAYREATVGLAP